MTTVAVNWPHFAADTQLSGGGTINRVSKLVRLPDGGVAGGAGQWNKAYAALRWFAAGEHGDCPEFEGAVLVIGRPDGSVWLAEDQLPAYPLIGGMTVIGSGSQGAHAAMRDGKTPRQAVEGVIGTDRGTSAPIECMTVCVPTVSYKAAKK